MDQSLAGRRVLVVEDEYFIADELARSLADLGADVVGPVAGENEALAFLDTEKVDLAVLDINLEGRIGFAVADALSRLAVPFVFATGYDRGTIPGRYQRVPHWEKPFDAAALARSLAGMQV
jgi:CheY-like chemotaxis protein